MRPPAREKNGRSVRQSKLATIAYTSCIVLVTAGIAFCLVSFLRNSEQLDEELKQERMTYVNEISNQISTTVYNRRDRLLSQISDSASTLNYVGIQSFEDMQRLYADKITQNYSVALCDETGRCYDMQGKQFPLQNNRLLSQTLSADSSQYSFEKSTSGLDYWIFSHKIEPMTFDGHTFVAVFELYDVSQFQSVLSLQLFDDVGFALILNQDGTVNLRPSNDDQGIGYNAINTFQSWGMPADTADSIKEDMANLQNNRLYVEFSGTNWLIDYKNIEGSTEYVAVVTPIALTSAGVTKSLQASYLNVGGMVGGVALLLVMLILRNTQLQKKRNKELYELRLQSKVVESKNDFLAKMSHDIRTPLNAIIGMNFIATTQLDDSSPVKENLQSIDVSAKYLLSILNDILDMSKIESGKMEIHREEFNLEELLNDIKVIAKPQATDKGLEFSYKFDPAALGFYQGDQLRIRQILMNLISNAIKFTPKGGLVTLKSELIEKSERTAMICFSISDNGIGMTEEFLKTIFTPFTQDGTYIAQKYGGSGLGLSITKSFVDLMGGSISVKSREGKGSTFKVFLPLEPLGRPSSAVVGRAHLLDEQRLKGKRVLLAEDNDVNMIIAKKILSMLGMNVEEAVNGKQALELFLSHPAEYYSVIISDIRMPEMNGYELANSIRHSNHPDASAIPILAMSANAFDDDVAASLSHGMNAHLKKPIDIEELKEALCMYAREEGENDD